jgi:integrase
MAVDRIDTDHVLKVVKPIWESRHETASRVRGRIERILDWARAKKLRDAVDNPARWDGHMEHLLANGVRRVEHLEAVPVRLIPKFMAKVRAYDRVSARALELLCLTATRTNEVRGATFGEFDLKNKVWIIPAARTKTGKRSGEDHIVPLSDRAATIVANHEGGQRRGSGAARPAIVIPRLVRPERAPARPRRIVAGARRRVEGRAVVPAERAGRAAARHHGRLEQVLRRVTAFAEKIISASSTGRQRRG